MTAAGTTRAMPGWPQLLRAGVGALCLLLREPARAADSDSALEESRLKLAMMYNFSNFIEWPAAVLPRPDSPFLFCVMGNDPFGTLLQPLEKRNYHGHPIQLAHPATVEAARKCHILYVDNPGGTALGRDVIRALAGAPVLTVSSGAEAIDAGIAIGFVQHNDRMRWNMNLTALHHAQLKASAKLIEIAVSVVGEGGR